MLDELTWKVSVAFALGAAAHYVLSGLLQPATKAQGSTSSPPGGEKHVEDAQAELSGSSSDESDDGEWEGADEESWQPHKMVLCVRTDLKMGKGTVCSLL